MNFDVNRRLLLKSGGAALAGMTVPSCFYPGSSVAKESRSALERPNIGVIGLRYQGSVIAEKAQSHGDLKVFCDADKNIREMARAAFGSRAKVYENYRDMLEKEKIDVVLIGTPDHWHTKMLIDSCRAGKDVYCEKPLTLTIDEGKLIRRVVKETGRVVQVGSWQRSDHRFRLAVEMVHAGRLGRLKRVDVVLGKNKQGGPFATDEPPKNLNWELWQGQTPDVPYTYERSHYTFRWWQEYSGGQMTDWGAHNLDIAQWGIGANPVLIEGQATYPNVENGYNVATEYHATYRYPDDVVMTVSDHGRAGIMFTGSAGRIFVNRGSIEGKPVEDLEANPLRREDFSLYDYDNLDRPERAGKLESIVNHMGNFFDCIRSRKQPISDIESQHRSVSTCHLGNIAMQLGRPLEWDAEAEQFPADKEANTYLSREQRKGYEIT